MNILIGFLSKIHNSNLNLYIVHFGQPSVAVARMSTDDASRLKSSCSRSCLGRVSVLSLSFFGDVSVLFWCCLGLVSVMSRSCLGRVSVSVLFW